MSVRIVIQQMIIIFILIFTGVYLYKRKHLSNESSRQLSWLIVNITNPITLLCAALSEEQKVGAGEIGMAFLYFFALYAILIPVSYLIPVLLKVDKGRRYAYHMLSIFGNVGFIGIPISSAVLGPSSLIYVSICGLTYNILMYTYGVASLKRTAVIQHPGSEQTDGFSLKNAVNSGMVFAVITIIVYLTDLSVPDVISGALGYMANCTTFLSMIVLGVSVAQMIPEKVFTNRRLYVFVAVRQILVPVLLIYILRPFITDELTMRTVVVMAAMPSGNLPLMMAKQYKVEEDMISAGIILTTLASIITIPVVMYFL